MAGLARHHGKPDRHSGRSASAWRAKLSREGFSDILLLGMGGSSLCPEVLDKDFWPRSRAFRSCTCSIPPIPRRSRLSRTRSIWRKRCLLFPANPARRSNRIFSSNISSNAYKQAVGADKAGSHFIADHRSRLENAASRRGRQLPPHFLRRSQHWRTLLGALATSAWFPPRPDGSGRQRSFSIAPKKWSRPAFRRFTVARKSRRHARHHSRHRRQERPRQSHHHRFARHLRSSAHGSSNCSPNPPASRATASSPWIAKLWAHPRFTAMTACSPTSAWNPRRTPHQDAKVAALEQAGQPVIRIAVADIYELGQEFFRWEIATAVAGSIIGINAFNQPDVEASKIATRDLTDRLREDRLPAGRNAYLRRQAASSFLPIPRMPTRWPKPPEATNRWPAIFAPISIASARAIISRCSASSR